jgi:hypothetical protein
MYLTTQSVIYMSRIFKIFLTMMCAALSAGVLRAQPGSGSMTPIGFNEQLTSITDSLMFRGQQWGRAFNEANRTRAYASLKSTRLQLERFVDANIARVRVMKDVKNSYAFRMAMLSFLQYEKRMIRDAFMPLEQISPAATREEVGAKLARLKEFSKAEAAELEKVGAAQAAYAESNGFRIEIVEDAGEREP